LLDLTPLSCARPDPNETLTVDGITLSCSDEVITYVSRNLEPYRGFHIFMRALPAILNRRPKAHVVILGGDDVSYGRLPPKGETYRSLMLKEVGSKLDMQRVHFMGSIAYDRYLKVLQVSSVHVYLTYPFVLSWSMLEAMAAECLVIASSTAPVLEVIKDIENGLLVDFFSSDQIADRIDDAFKNRDRMAPLRKRARAKYTGVRSFIITLALLVFVHYGQTAKTGTRRRAVSRHFSRRRAGGHLPFR
jgi:glycosyltransferase involved in cell wall biosynthesis